MTKPTGIGRGGARKGAGRPRRDPNSTVPPARMQERWRERIRTTLVIDRLNKIALGEIMGEPAKLGVQVRAADILLRKTMPDLNQIENTGGRTLDEILFSAVAAIKAGEIKREPWVLPSEPLPPLELDAPLRSLDEDDGGE